MRRKVSSLFLSVVLLANMLGVMIQNAGESSSNLGETEGVPDSIPQIDGELSSSLSGSGGLADTPWPMYRHDLMHTGQSPYDTSTNPGKLKWDYTTDEWVLSSPAIDSDGTIYVGSYDDKFYAINPDGTEKWNFTTGFNVYSSPAISSDGTIYVGSDDNKLYAINPDGTEEWNFTADNHMHSSPAIDSNGTIYIGSYDYKLYAINPDGTEKWSFMVGYHVRSSPAIGTDGTIYVGSSSSDNKFYAINPDGTKKWTFTTGLGVSSSPSIGYDGTIYISSLDNKLYAINPNGTENWSFKTSSGVSSSPAIGSDGTIYFGSSDHKFYALNQDGSEKWNFLTGWAISSSPTISSDGTIYIGSGDHKLYAINNNGTEKWNFTTNDWIRSSPAIGTDGTIYFGSADGKLYAIGRTDVPPISDAGPDQTVNEGDIVKFDGSSSYDPDGTITIYEWDYDSSDGLWWETVAIPDATGPMPTHIYGDDGVYIVTLRVTDNDNLSSTDNCNVSVQNVNPTVTIESITIEVEIGLRVAGRKYNNVSMTLYEGGNPLGYVSIERMPGSPDEQMAWIPVSIDFSKSYSATVTYTPKDPPNVGGNPIWIYIKSQNGSTNKIHHTFNVQQSKKRDSEHWNHIEPWEVDLNAHFIGLPFEITSHITDPGSDDETLTFTHGSQVKTVTYLNNPPDPDPYPSPKINPRDIMDTTTLIYEGPGVVTLIVKDDDNIRSGVGQGSDSFNLG